MTIAVRRADQANRTGCPLDFGGDVLVNPVDSYHVETSIFLAKLGP